MSFSRIWPLYLFVLLGALHLGKTQGLKNLYDIANIHMVRDINDIVNIKDLQNRAVFYTRDCEELYQLGHTKSGLYVIRPKGSPKIVVQCYMYDCNGWTVIQRNSFNTEITWSNSWKTYKYGFGNIQSDHWLGNEYIHLLTSQKLNKVRIILTDAENKSKHAEYDSFYIKGEADKYQLRLGAYSGTAGDSLSNGILKNMHDNMRFSAHDNDNDRSHNIKCADQYGGGWWYDACYDAQLNRETGIHWQTLCDHNCQTSLILIKPAHMYCHRA